MTMPLHEQHVNLAESALDGGIDNSQTTLDVLDGSDFPSTGNFRIIIEDEIMICTARSTNTLTVVRGQDGSAAATHDDELPVRMIYTKQGVARLHQDHNALWQYSSRPAIQGVYNDAGTGRLVASDFTWVNQGGASRADSGQSITLRCPTDSGNNMRLLALTPGGNFTYVGAFRSIVASDGNYYAPAIMGLRESGTGKVITLSHGGSHFRRSRLSLGKWTDSSTLSGGVFVWDRNLLIALSRTWFKVEYDGSNVKFYGGCDGYNWVQFLSESKTTFFTTAPDQVVWGGTNLQNNGTGTALASELLVSLDHWHKE